LEPWLGGVAAPVERASTKPGLSPRERADPTLQGEEAAQYVKILRDYPERGLELLNNRNKEE
jgi:hypothetical protein